MNKIKRHLDSKYMIRLDKKIELIPLTFDFLFKGIFMNNLDILKEFIFSQLDININQEDCKIELLTNELPKENKKEYQKTVDIYVRINNYLYVNIEVNREHFKDIKLRNMLFADKLYSMILETGEHSKKLSEKYFVQINLNAVDRQNKSIISKGSDKIVLFWLESKQIYTENKYMLVKFLEYYRYLYYNKHEKLNNSEMWLVMLTSRNFQELYHTLGYILDDEKRDKYIREVIRMCSDKFVISEWYMKKLDEVVEETKIYNAKKELEEGKIESRRQGLEEGIQEGIKEGKKEVTIEYIKNMIDKKMDINLISEITNLSKEEIIKIYNKNSKKQIYN